jgi:hypothetical protein
MLRTFHTTTEGTGGQCAGGSRARRGCRFLSFCSAKTQYNRVAQKLKFLNNNRIKRKKPALWNFALRAKGGVFGSA